MDMLDCYTDVHRWCVVDTCTGIHRIYNATSTPITILASTQCPVNYRETKSPHPICDGMLVICINEGCFNESYMHLLRKPFLIKINESQTVCPAPSNTTYSTPYSTPSPSTTIYPTPSNTPSSTTTIYPTLSNIPLPSTTIYPTPSNTTNPTCNSSSSVQNATMLFLVTGILLLWVLNGT